MTATMRRLELDLLAPRRPAAGWIVLALAVLALLDTGATWSELRADLDAAEERAITPRARGDPRGRHAPPPGEGALRDADRVARALTLPWETLFRSLEQAATDDGVALLALQPDPQKQQLSISGEARDYAAILAFVARLDRREALRDVHLVRHEVRADDPQRPTYFDIVASWEPRP